MAGDLRRTPLYDAHVAAGAKLVDFAGWAMPLDYGSVLAEHTAVREHAGAFDVSHLGSLVLTGAQGQRAVQDALTGDIDAVAVGEAQYQLCLDDRAGIVDDLIAYKLPWGVMVVPNAANTDAVAESLRAAGGDPRDVTAERACIAVQGPASDDVLAAAGVDTGGLAYMECRTLGGDRPLPDDGLICRTGYTGERGYELFVPQARAREVWDAVVAAGAAPVGLGCRDTLRLEMGYALHGNDISTGTNPVEARLGWAVKAATEFHGRDAYLELKARGPTRRLFGLRATGPGIPRADCAITREGQILGQTTSGGFSPTLKAGIALGYLDDPVQPGEQVTINVRGRPLEAAVVRPPFVDADPKA